MMRGTVFLLLAVSSCSAVAAEDHTCASGSIIAKVFMDAKCEHEDAFLSGEAQRQVNSRKTGVCQFNEWQYGCYVKYGCYDDGFHADYFKGRDCKMPVHADWPPMCRPYVIPWSKCTLHLFKEGQSYYTIFERKKEQGLVTV